MTLCDYCQYLLLLVTYGNLVIIYYSFAILLYIIAKEQGAMLHPNCLMEVMINQIDNEIEPNIEEQADLLRLEQT